MDMYRELHIDLFTESYTASVYLPAILSQVGYTVFTHLREERPLVVSLETIIAQVEHSGSCPYDLIIIEILSPDEKLQSAILPLLVQLVSFDAFALLVLTDIHHEGFDRLRARLPNTPLISCHPQGIIELFEAIVSRTGRPPLDLSKLLESFKQIRREHSRQRQQEERAWVELRQQWLDQRQQWLDERQRWLDQRREWLDHQRRRADPQREWLDEQQAWVQQQYQEVKQQRRWVDDFRRWINRYQNKLNQQGSSPFSEAE